MKRIVCLLLSLLMIAAAAIAPAETILWEDENGQVILNDDGDIDFVPLPTPAPTAEPDWI